MSVVRVRLPPLERAIFSAAASEVAVLNDSLVALLVAVNALSATASIPAAAKIASAPVSSGALKSIFALSEAYPDLKANQNFLELQRELTDTEDKLQASRRFYNSNVRNINVAVQQFPKNIVAKTFSFGEMEFFELDESELEAASKPVEVAF